MHTRSCRLLLAIMVARSVQPLLSFSLPSSSLPLPATWSRAHLPYPSPTASFHLRHTIRMATYDSLMEEARRAMGRQESSSTRSNYKKNFRKVGGQSAGL
eukprot:763573-Hanusia_phi.AAC.4